MIGSGDNALNLVFAGDVARGMVRAAAVPAAARETYNLSASASFTQRQFLDALTGAMGLPSLTRRLPYWLAYRVGFLVELMAKALRVRRNLRITRHGVSLLGSSMTFSSAKAREQLGWVPEVAPLDGLAQTVAWYFGEARTSSRRPPGRPETSLLIPLG